MLQQCLLQRGEAEGGPLMGGPAAPHGPALCGLCLTSDSSGSQPGCTLLTFSGPFLFYSNNCGAQWGGWNRIISSSGIYAAQLLPRRPALISPWIDQVILVTTVFIHLRTLAAFLISSGHFYLLKKSVKWALSTYGAVEPLPCTYLAQRDSHTHFYQSKIDQYSFCTVLTNRTEISVVKSVRSFTLMWIFSQAHKYHILLTFICWQTDLKYRSTISVLITCNGNNRCGAEQKFWSGLQVWSSVWGCASSHEQRGRRVAIMPTAQFWRWISPLLFGLGCCECGRELMHRCKLNCGHVAR